MKTLNAVTANISGTLKSLNTVQANVNGALKQIFGALPANLSGETSGGTLQSTVVPSSCTAVFSVTLLNNALSTSGYTVAGSLTVQILDTGGNVLDTVINASAPFSKITFTANKALNAGTYRFNFISPTISGHPSTITYSIKFQ